MDRSDATWTDQLSSAVAAALDEHRDALKGERLVMLAIDCHPWNGFLNLAVLTHAEVLEDPSLNDPAEMAAWKHFDLARDSRSWAPTRKLARAMSRAYDKGVPSNNHAQVAREYMMRCAEAITSDRVRTALARYNKTRTFRISVAHPDSDEEFCPAPRRRSSARSR